MIRALSRPCTVKFFLIGKARQTGGGTPMIRRSFSSSDPVAASYSHRLRRTRCRSRSTRSVTLPFTSSPLIRRECAFATSLTRIFTLTTFPRAVPSQKLPAPSKLLFAEAAANFPFFGVHDDEVLGLGNVTISVLHTPGHTPSTSPSLSLIERAPTSHGSRSLVTRSWWRHSRPNGARDERGRRCARTFRQRAIEGSAGLD